MEKGKRSVFGERPYHPLFAVHLSKLIEEVVDDGRIVGSLNDDFIFLGLTHAIAAFGFQCPPGAIQIIRKFANVSDAVFYLESCVDHDIAL
jgi:hypothetical protein